MPASLIIMITKCLLLVSVVLDLTGLVQSFQPLFASDGNSTSHRKITIRAVLRKTAEVCGNIAATEGRDFTLTIDDTLTADRVQESCSVSDNSTSLLSNVPFHISIGNMYFNNANVDLESMLSEEYHFHGEKFQKGRDLITKGVSAVKASVKLENFITGRWILGQVCHTLQDFYSHSNWVELGNTAPYNALIKPYKTLENLAGPNISTCRNCTGDNCDDNILPDVLQQGLLTSGYFNLMSSEKPDGKCSHGGAFDQTSKREPVGGINKDKIWSSHGSLHHEAADLAENATVELLEEIRIAVGDQNFLRLMGLSQSSALCFVIDTTGSMSNDIAEAKRVSFNIIDRKRGTQQEPSAYILVPFNDPGFGPLLMTTDADKFKESINQLTANGGGDIPESSLSGLQLALTAAPASSQIFVFTDAPAKDAALKSTITALIESTKSEVTFMLTHVLTSRSIRTLNQADAQLYRDLAWASGGQAIEVSKSDLALATRVIEDSSSSAMVTVFQVVMNPGKSDKFTFIVDTSLRNITIYITGTSSLLFNLTSATGICQHSNESSGPLASLTLAGNLQRLILNNDHETGLWEISVDSNDTYSVKVTGQSSMNFIYNLVEAHEGLHGDFFLKEGRPLSGGNVTLLVTVVGCDSVNNAEITLHDSSGPADVDGTLQSLGGSDFLVTFNEIPAGNFVVRLKGEDSSSSKSTSNRFQRQVSTHIKTSSISLTAQANSMNIEPGSTVFIPFTVTTTISGVVNETATGTFTVRATNDRSFDSTSPTSVTIGTDSGGTANGTVTLTAPNSAVSGTGVSLMIEAEDADGTDINYVVLRFSIAAEAQANSMNIEPGSTVFIPVTVTTTTSGVDNETETGTFTLRATNDHSFDSTSPSSVTIETDSGGRASGTVTLTTPISAVSGMGVTLIEAEDADATDINYVLLGFSDAAEMTDFNGPVCQEVSTSSSCSSSSLCYSSQWQFVVNVTDGVNGTGIERVTVRVGSGTLSTTTVVGPGGENITVASYWASCCAQRVELSVVDNVGNVGVCVGEVRQSTTVAPVTAAKVTTNTISTGGYTLSSTLWVWITVVALPLWK